MSTPTISEYSASINAPQMIKASILAGGSPKKKNGRLIKYSGGFCVVFPYETSGKKYAVRCWHTNIKDIQHRIQLISEALKSSGLPYFVGFNYFPNGLITTQGPQAIVVMDWVNARTLKSYISAHINDTSTIRRVAERFKEMVADLHKHHIAHGDLQHGNIMVKDNGDLILVDYDSIYAPTLSGVPDTIKGLPGYQHPARWKNDCLNEKIDYFSELIIYTSILALSKHPELWDKLNLEDTETMIFSSGDISSKGSASIFTLLDNDSELKPLSGKIKEYLRKDSIMDLKPLEEAIGNSNIGIAETMSKRWGGRECPKTVPDYTANASNISKKWQE